MKQYTTKRMDKAINKWSKIQAEAAKCRMPAWKYVERFGIVDELIIKLANNMKANKTR